MLSIPVFSDPVSSLTHLAGAAVFAILGGFLIARGRGDARRVLSLAVFVFSCVLLLSLSGVYHLLTPETAARGVLVRLDHAAIFVLIAGSFTPVHVILLPERWQRHLLAWIWGAAIAGLTLKTVYFDATPPWLGLLMYLGLGWLVVISTVALAAAASACASSCRWYGERLPIRSARWRNFWVGRCSFRASSARTRYSTSRCWPASRFIGRSFAASRPGRPPRRATPRDSGAGSPGWLTARCWSRSIRRGPSPERSAGRRCG